MALFSRNFDEELDNSYAPLEEFAPTFSKQEVVERKRLSTLLTPLNDIPTALRGRRDQIESDLKGFSLDQDEAFVEAKEVSAALQRAQKGHVSDVNTLKSTMDRVKGAIDTLSSTVKKLPEFPEINEKEDIEIPQINLPKLSEEFMPDQELIDQIRGYSSYSHVLKKSVEYSKSSLEQYHDQVKALYEKRELLENLAAKADLLALNSTIDATHLSEESREFSTKIAGEVGALSRHIHEITAAIDAEIDNLENGYRTVRSSLTTIESAHRDATHYSDMYSSACNEYYRQSTNYTNILIQSLSALNKEFREVIDKKDSEIDECLSLIEQFHKDTEAFSRSIIQKGDRIESVLDGCIRGADSLSEEMQDTMKIINELHKSLSIIQKNAGMRTDKYTKALLKAFDRDLVWLRNKIEAVYDEAGKE